MVLFEISAFASLIAFPIGITSSAVGLKICALTAGIRKVYVNYNEQLSYQSFDV